MIKIRGVNISALVLLNLQTSFSFPCCPSNDLYNKRIQFRIACFIYLSRVLQSPSMQISSSFKKKKDDDDMMMMMMMIFLLSGS